MSEELEQCPFCGCSVEMKDDVNYPSPKGQHDYDCPLEGEDIVATQESWNRRATPPAAQVQGEREAFEAWVRRERPGSPLQYVRDALPVDHPRYGEYCDDTLQCAWEGWQARAALSAPPAADDSEPAEALAARLIEVRAAALGHAVPWAEAVEITATITKMAADEKADLLAMDDAPPAAGVPSPEPMAEVISDGVMFLRKQPDGSPWPRGTKLYAAPPASEQQQAVVLPKITGTAIVEVVNGAEGPSLYIGNEDGGYRLAGPKPWGGGRTIHKFTVKLDELVREAMDLAGVNQGVTTEAGNGGEA